MNEYEIMSMQTKEMLEKKIAFIESKILSEKKRALEYKKKKNDRGEYMLVYFDLSQADLDRRL